MECLKGKVVYMRWLINAAINGNNPCYQMKRMMPLCGNPSQPPQRGGVVRQKPLQPPQRGGAVMRKRLCRYAERVMLLVFIKMLSG
jgi:hypothetical protein